MTSANNRGINNDEMNSSHKETPKDERKRFSIFLYLSLLFIAVWWWLIPISYDWSADMVALIRTVEQFSNQGNFPVKGILSSVAAYNMPGLVWILLPASLIFSDPRFIAMATAIPLNILGAFLLFKLASRSMNNHLSFACMITYCLSPLTFQWSRSLWAQHYLGAFYILIAYFLTKWVIDRMLWCGPTAIVCIVYATMIHFSAVVLFAAWGFVWLLWRPPTRLRGILLAFFISAILLSPYLHFQTKRDFRDLRAFVIGKSLVYEQAISLDRSDGLRASDLSVQLTQWGSMAEHALKGFWRLLLSNFSPLFWTANAIAISFSLYQSLLGSIFIVGFALISFLTVKSLIRHLRSSSSLSALES